ncbi:hypothetical protein CLF_103740, partial [Clonorchis sinensis]
TEYPYRPRSLMDPKCRRNGRCKKFRKRPQVDSFDWFSEAYCRQNDSLISSKPERLNRWTNTNSTTKSNVLVKKYFLRCEGAYLTHPTVISTSVRRTNGTCGRHFRKSASHEWSPLFWKEQTLHWIIEFLDNVISCPIYESWYEIKLLKKNTSSWEDCGTEVTNLCLNFGDDDRVTFAGKCHHTEITVSNGCLIVTFSKKFLSLVQVGFSARTPLNERNKPYPGGIGKSPDPVYHSVDSNEQIKVVDYDGLDMQRFTLMIAPSNGLYAHAEFVFWYYGIIGQKTTPYKILTIPFWSPVSASWNCFVFSVRSVWDRQQQGSRKSNPVLIVGVNFPTAVEAQVDYRMLIYKEEFAWNIAGEIFRLIKFPSIVSGAYTDFRHTFSLDRLRPGIASHPQIY